MPLDEEDLIDAPPPPEETPAAVPEPVVEDDEEEEEAPPAEAEPDFASTLEKFDNDPEALAKHLTSTEKASKELTESIAAREVSDKEMRQKLYDAGWTFDPNGQAIPPKVETAAPAPTVERPDWMEGEDEQATCKDGIWYDRYGQPLITKDMMAHFKETMPPADYALMMVRRDEHIRRYDENQRADVTKRADENLTFGRQNVDTFLEEVPAVRDNPLMADIRKQADDNWAKMTPDQRTAKDAYDMAFFIAAVPHLKTLIAEAVENASAHGAETALSNKRVVATQAGGIVKAGAPAPATTRLTAEELKMAEAYGMNAEDYIKYGER